MKCGECGTYCCANGWEAQAVVLSGHNPACSQFYAKTLTEAAVAMIKELVVEIEFEAMLGDGISAKMEPVYLKAKHLLGEPAKPAEEWPIDDTHKLGPNGEHLVAVPYTPCKHCSCTDSERPCRQPSIWVKATRG